MKKGLFLSALMLIMFSCVSFAQTTLTRIGTTSNPSNPNETIYATINPGSTLTFPYSSSNYALAFTYSSTTTVYFTSSALPGTIIGSYTLPLSLVTPTNPVSVAGNGYNITVTATTARNGYLYQFSVLKLIHQ